MQPVLQLILNPDFRIVDANDEYLNATLVRRADIVGCTMFEAFPDNPTVTGADGVRNLRASLTQVLALREPNHMPLQRYDVRDRLTGNGAWVEKFWVPSNLPVRAGDSEEISHILHEVQDVTEALALSRHLREQSLIMREMLSSLRQLRRDWRARQRVLREARLELKGMMRNRTLPTRNIKTLGAAAGAPPASRYFCPGDRAPIRGIYHALHAPTCMFSSHRILMREGEAFARCSGCNAQLLYRLVSRFNG